MFLTIVNQHPLAHHPLDVRYYLVVDELELNKHLVSSWYLIL
jgi:hypothetical protein